MPGQNLPPKTAAEVGQGCGALVAGLLIIEARDGAGARQPGGDALGELAIITTACAAHAAGEDRDDAEEEWAHVQSMKTTIWVSALPCRRKPPSQLTFW